MYDAVKGMTFPTLNAEELKGRGKTRVKSVAWVKSLLKKKPLKRPPVVITNVKAVEPMIRDLNLEKHRDVVERLVRYVTEGGNNAMAIKGKKTDYLVLPPKIHKAIVEHEVGHLRDFEERGDKRPGVLERLAKVVWKPTYRKHVIEPEERAWSHVPTKTGIKEKALGTYHRGFHSGRAGLAGALGAALLTMGAVSRFKGKS